MDEQIGTTRPGPARATGIALAVAVLAIVSGCTAELGDGGSAAPPTSATSSPTRGAVPTPDPTATAEALAAEDAARLPMAPDDIKDWAVSTVPTTGSEGYLTGYSGWLSEHSSPRTTSTFGPAPAGRYTVSVACVNGGPLAASVQQLDEAEVGALQHPCDGSVQSVGVETGTDGIVTVLENPVTSEPAVYAVSIARLP